MGISFDAAEPKIPSATARQDDGAGVRAAPPAPQTRNNIQMRASSSWPPVIVLGGENGALSVARSLSLAGITVYAINRPQAPVLRSRHVTPLAIGGDASDVRSWRDFLLSAISDHLEGAALFCCGDESIKLVVENWDALSARYLLEPCPPRTRLNFLDKLSTYEIASASGVVHPRYWRLRCDSDVAEIARNCRFPVILKPRLSENWPRIGAKYLRANHVEELKRHYDRCVGLDIAIIAMEFIPGADDRYCSYYTYIDDDGAPLVHFTKRILRRHPMNEGGATYHITDWNPEVAEKGLRLFQQAGLRGLGNVEFKRDPRDGELKLIEVNARYTAANALVTLSGIDLALLSYGQLTGRPYAAPRNYGLDLAMWEPIPDFLAFCALKARREITLALWLRQVGKADITPNFDWRDPLPAIHYLAEFARGAARKLKAGRRGVRDQAAEPPAATPNVKGEQ